MNNLITGIAVMSLAGLVSGCSYSRVEESKVSDTLRNCKTDSNTTFTVTTKKEKNTYPVGSDIRTKWESLGFVEYTYLCDPEVEWSDGEVKMNYVLKATREGTAYHSVGLLSNGLPPTGILYGLLRDGVQGGKW
jgi:hypothetical protein